MDVDGMVDDENSDFVAGRCWPTGRRTKARSQPRRRPERNSFFDAKVVPSIAYTDPEDAWAA